MTADGLLLVEDGVARTTIVYWDDESPVIAFAAGELASYLERISGARFAVQIQRGARPRRGLALVTGPVSEATLADCEQALAAAHGDAYAIRAAPDEGVVLLGLTERSVLYAAYDVLRRLGVRFYAPKFDQYDGHAEHLPSARSLRLDSCDVLEQPSFDLRRKYVEEGWSHGPRPLREVVDWMAKSRLNALVHPYDYGGQGVVRWDDVRDDLLPELRRRGIVVEVGGHGYEAFLPPDRHPSYYTAGTGVFDVDNAEAVQAYTARVVEYLRARPEIAVFDAWPPDDGEWPEAGVATFGSVADAYAAVTNALVRAVARAQLDVRIEAVAYNKHISPPSAAHRLDDSALLDFAAHDRGYDTSMFDDAAPSNVVYRQLFTEWSSCFAGSLAIFEYYRKYSWHSLPVLLVRLVLDEIPRYRAAGFTGVGTYSEPDDWITYEPIHLLVAELSWNVDLPGETWLRDHLEQRYGAAARGIASYLGHVERAGRLLFDRADGNYGCADVVRVVRDEYLAAGKVLSRVEADEEPAAFLVGRLRQNLDYAIADTEIDYYRLLGDEPAWQEAIRRTAALLEELRGRGIVVDSVWTRKRLHPTADRESTRWLYDAYREGEGTR